MPDFWTFMLQIYALPGIAPSCLRLQEICAVDVPWFLALLHAAAHGRAIDAPQVAQTDALCAQWRGEVVRPLRQIRTDLKHNPWMVTDHAVSDYRESVKALELGAERIEVAFLERWLRELPEARTPVTRGELQRVAELMLDLCAPLREQKMPQEAGVIVEATLKLRAARSA